MTSFATGNVADLVRDAAAQDGQKTAFRAGREALTWAEVEVEVAALAAGLLAQGAAPGERVAIQLGNVLEFPLVYFAVLRAGLVAVPLNTAYTAPELLHCLGDSGAALLITSGAGLEVARSVAADLPALRSVVVAAETAPPGVARLDSLRATGGAPPGAGAAAGADLAVIVYTSGTSGRPKGAMLSHRALLANLAQCGRIEPPVTAPQDVVLLVLPLFHIYGLNAALGAVAAHAATGVLIERFDPVDTLDQIRRFGVTNVVGAPPMYVAWSMLPDVGDAFSSVRLAVSGGAPLPSAVLHRFRDVTGHHVFEGYGLTETAPVLTSTLMSEVAKPASIGQAIPGVELKLVDEQGRPVEEGDPGEIVVRGDNLFSGYWPDAADGPDADGWFATGDVAVVDADGDLFLVDRRRELILVSGFNVYPREVEDVLGAHPDVEEAAVLGIGHPYTGEAVKALVVLRPGSRLTAEEVIAHCARSLARFKCPTAVEFVDELPHSVTGKVSKGQLRAASSSQP